MKKSEPVASPAAHSTNGKSHGMEPARPEELGEDLRPAINITGVDFPVLRQKAIDALVAANDPPQLFRRTGGLVRVEHDENGILVCRYVTVPIMRNEMTDAAAWYKMVDDSEVRTVPRREIVEGVLAAKDLPFPVLQSIQTAPFFTPGGVLVSSSGYEPTSRIILALDPELSIPTIPVAPKRAAVLAAVELIKDLLHDFPFADDASRAHAFALLLLPFVRRMIAGQTPLHLAEAPAEGTGKSLLLRVLLAPGCGRVPIRTLGRDEEEVRKSITTALVKGTAAIVFDNLKGRVDSANLAAVLTAPTWSDRRLGSNTDFEVDVTMVLAASANNASLSTEIVRRTVSMRLDAGCEHPEDRIGWKHKDLAAYASESRADLIRAACTLVAAWIAAGRPPGDTTLGSYEAWAACVGGILKVAGIPGFLADRERLREAADMEMAGFRAFVVAWLERHGTAEVAVAELLPFAANAGMDFGTDDAGKMKARLGKRLSASRDRVLFGHRIQFRKQGRGPDKWRLWPSE